MQLNKEDRKTLNPLRDDIKAYWDYYLPEGWSYSIGGGTTLALVLSELVTKSQYYSLIGALIIVWIIVSIMFRSPVAGLMGMIPVVYALLGIFSFMVVFQFSLDIITSLLASLAIGIGVDYAIHYMNAYKRCIKEGETNPLQKVYRTTGSAIFFNALSVAVGFLGLLISRFIPIQQLGILFSVSMVCACLASLIVLPMVLEITKPRFLRK
jgi:predicted RND superfamily exporter protein